MDSSLSIYSAVVNIILIGNDCHGRNSIFNGGAENYHLETNLGITAIYTTLLPLSEFHGIRMRRETVIWEMVMRMSVLKILEMGVGRIFVQIRRMTKRRSEC